VGIHDLVNVFLYYLDAQKFWKYIFISVMIKWVIVDIVKCACHECIYMLVYNIFFPGYLSSWHGHGSLSLFMVLNSLDMIGLFIV
jgi:hypothetical protein